MAQQTEGGGSRTDRIRISPSQMKAVAREFKVASEQSDQMVRNLDKQMEAMKAEWEGMTRQTFVTHFEQWKKSMINFVGLLNGVNVQLTNIATEFERAEAQAKQYIGKS